MLLAVLSLLAGVQAYNNGQGATPPLGWNTWCTMGTCGNLAQDELHDVCWEEEVKSVAEAMLKNGMYALGFRHINLDDCWADPFRAENGSLVASPIRFPSGMAGLADWLHARGLKLGLYTSAGTTTCSSGGRIFNIPGSYGHYQIDAQTFASWGVDYVKIDWCGKELNNALEQHSEFSQALNATGREIFLELCRGYSLPPPPYVAQVAQSWRESGDHHDVFSSTLSEIDSIIGNTGQSGPYQWAYLDFLMTGGAGCDTTTVGAHCPGQTDDEYISEASIWMITQSPLIVATDIRNMTDIMQLVLLNEELISMHQDTSTPPGDLIGYWPCGGSATGCQIWARNVYNSTTYAVALFNTASTAEPITFSFNLLDWGTTPVVVRDLWLHETLPGTVSVSYTAQVPSHGTNYVLFTQA